MLQYLVGVEGIAPDIITATSAGAIAATVLAQARTLDEFAQRVDEIEGDVLAWTQTEHVFGKQAWLGALDGTALGREIHHEITEGTRPPFPLSPATVLAGSEASRPPPAPTAASGARSRRARRRRQRHLLRLVAGAGFRLPRVRRQLRTSGSSVLNLEPLADALRHGTDDGVRPVDPALVRRPGLQLRLAVTALRAGVLRYVTEDGTIVESDARTPAPGRGRRPGRPDRRRHRLGQRAHGLPAPPDGRRRLRRRRGDRDHPRRGPRPRSGATRIFAVVAVPLDARPRRAGLRGGAGRLHRAALHGHDRRRRAPALQPRHPPARGDDARRRSTRSSTWSGLFEVEPGLLRINKDYGWLRAADVLAEGDAGILADVAEGTPRRRRGPLRGLAPRGVALGRRRQGRADGAGTLALVREQKEQVRDAGRAAQAARLPRARRLRGLVDRVRGAHGAPARRACPEPLGRARLTRAGAGRLRTAQTVGPPSQPRRRNSDHEEDDRDDLEADPEHEEAPGRRQPAPGPGRRSSARRTRSGS